MLAALPDNAVGKFSLFSDLFDQRRQKHRGVGKNGQIYRRQFLDIRSQAAHSEIGERDMDHLATGLERNGRTPDFSFVARQNAVKIHNIQCQDNVRVADQLSFFAGQVERVSVGKVETTAAVDHRASPEVSQLDE